MSFLDIAIYTLKFFIPSLFSMLFRVNCLGNKGPKRVVLGIAVYSLYSLIVPAFLIHLIGYGEYTHIASIVMLIGSMSVLIFSSDTPGITIFLHWAQSIMMAAISALLNMFRHLFGFSYLTLLIAFMVVSPLCYFIAKRYCAKPMRFIAENLHGNILPLLLLPVTAQILIMLIPTYPKQNYANHPVFCTFIMVLISFCFFMYLYNLYQSLRQISILTKETHKWELIRTEISSYEEYLQTAKQNRHDIRHHNALILEYLSDGNAQKAKEYLQNYDCTMEQKWIDSYCENFAANAVLRLYGRKARSEQVLFAVQADIPEKLFLPDTEMVIVLSNILENACMACEAHQDENPAIVVTATYDENLKIEVKNSVYSNVAFNEHGMPISSRANGGTGTKSVAAVVAKHKGMVRFLMQENSFISQIIIPVP